MPFECDFSKKNNIITIKKKISVSKKNEALQENLKTPFRIIFILQGERKDYISHKIITEIRHLFLRHYPEVFQQSWILPINIYLQQI